MSFMRQAIYPCNPGTERGHTTKLSASKDKVIYTNGRNVIILDLKNPALSTTFSGHTQNTTVARFSPSGYYCASADATGLVKIWDTVNPDQTVKGEYKVISGRINDLAWDGESKRIIAVGDGREKFGHAFMFDTGTSTGEIAGHSKVINAVSIRQTRPFRAATAGDDGLIIFHQGPPFKYSLSIRTHTKFVQDVKYSPNGERFASVGSDFKVFLYDGKEGTTIAELTDSSHKGSIMACSWNPDSSSFMTSSLDRSVKLWDIQSQRVTRTWALGTDISSQQVGNVWVTPDELASLSLSGDLNVFDKRTDGDKPARVIQGPQKSITAATRCTSGTFLTGTADGRIFSYSTPPSNSVSTTKVIGGGHTNLVSGLAPAPGSTEKVYSTGFDDRAREIDVGATSSSFTPASIEAIPQPKGLAVTEDGTVFLIQSGSENGRERNIVQAVKDNQSRFVLELKYTPTAVAASGKVVVVGGGEGDKKVHVYTWEDGLKLVESYILEGNKSPISAIAVSADKKLIAAGDTQGNIILFDADKKAIATDRWTHHASRIASLSFFPSSTSHLASISLDTNLYVYNVGATNTAKYVAIRGAAPGGGNAVFWLDGDKTDGKARVASAGADGCVRVWEVLLP
ncbi:WD40-repeat-containing domain protein [Phlebopus sp. FC_14]|nr:WD40-repeat-containing domain protein [Phlebopus sp. FC_14]